MDNFFYVFMSTLYQPLQVQAYRILARVQHHMQPHQYEMFHGIFTKFFREKLKIQHQTRMDMTDFLCSIVPQDTRKKPTFLSMRILMREANTNYQNALRVYRTRFGKLQNAYENWRKIHSQPFPLSPSLFASCCKLEKNWETEQIRYHKSTTDMVHASKILGLVQKIAQYYGYNTLGYEENIPEQLSFLFFNGKDDEMTFLYGFDTDSWEVVICTHTERTYSQSSTNTNNTIVKVMMTICKWKQYFSITKTLFRILKKIHETILDIF